VFLRGLGALRWVDITLGISFLFLAVYLKAHVVQFTRNISGMEQSGGSLPQSMKGKITGLAPDVLLCGLLLWQVGFRDLLEATDCPC